MDDSKLARRLTAMDAVFVYTEHETAPMHIGGVSILEGKLDRDAFAADLASKIHRIPRYRQRLIATPMNLGHPTWEADPDFDIDNHIEEVRVKRPGDDARLQELAGDLFAEVLDRDFPLWKIYLVSGMKGGRSAMITLVHHCMVDGVSGSELLQIILDPSPEPEVVDPREYTPSPIPPKSKLLIDAVWDNIETQVETWSEFQRNLLGLARNVRGSDIMPLVRELPSLLRDFAWPVKNLPFNERNFSGERKLSWTTCSFSDIRAIRKECGGTINDIVLTALSGAIREYLIHHGVKIKRTILRVMVPVSLRREEERGSLGNRVSLLPVDIRLDTVDPIDRLHAIHERTTALKRAKVAESLNLIFQLWQGALPPVQAAVGSAIFAPRLQRALGIAVRTPGLHMVCTNVPGPQIPLYALGKKLLAHYPLLPVVPGMGLNLGVFSYNHVLHFGIIADANAAPDVDFFRDLLDESLEELRQAAGVEKSEPIEFTYTPLGQATGKRGAKRAPRKKASSKKRAPKAKVGTTNKAAANGSKARPKKRPAKAPRKKTSRKTSRKE